MVLHEMTTNAMKYGALSVPDGCVDVEWHGAGAGVLQLSWQERGGPIVEKPTTRGAPESLARTADFNSPCRSNTTS